MTSHLCTMLIECILLYIVFLTVKASVSGTEIRTSPFGSLMCKRLCHRTVGCVYFFYAPHDLTCYLGNTSTALDRDAVKIAVSKVVGNTSTDISKCPRNSKTIQSRSKKLICFRKNQRRNIKSNDAQFSLQPAQPETITPRNAAFVQCNSSIGLYQASAAGDLRRVQIIVSKGLEDINCRGKYKRTPVMAAVRKGHEKVFDFLISHGCDLYCVDCHNNTVLHLSCKGVNDVILKTLIDNGYFDIDVRGHYDRTPLMYASWFGRVGLFKILIGKGSNPKIRDTWNDTILHVACWDGHVEMVKYILSLNIDGVGIESKGCDGRTPVLSAVYYNEKQVTEFLVSQGCNLSAVDDDGNNILHYACNETNVDIVKYIISLETGNEKRENNDGHTPVQLTDRNGYGSISALLTERLNVKSELKKFININDKFENHKVTILP